MGEQSDTVQGWDLAIVVASVSLGFTITGLPGAVIGGVLGWGAYRAWRASAAQPHVEPPRSTRNRSATDSQRNWRRLPVSEQIRLAKTWERDADKDPSQIYWYLIEAAEPVPQAYIRLAEMYRRQGNDPQVIHVLDRAIDTFSSANGTDESDKWRSLLRSLRHKRRAAIRRNNSRYRLPPSDD
jgi:hypothetical protein